VALGPAAAQAAADRQFVVCVTTSDTQATDPKLNALNQETIPSLMVVIVDLGPSRGEKPLSLNTWAGGFGNGSLAASAQDRRAVVCLPDSFATALDTLVTRTYTKLRPPAVPMPAVSPELEAGAIANGIPVVQTLLAGPGGERR
jgi:hypothetical protein